MSPFCSIIILSFNRFAETTGPCLESLYSDNELQESEIIVIDNASWDDAGRRLQAATRGRRHVRPVFNPVNRGFAGGNNDGAALARADILVLLNSDTIVPAGAMGRLVRTLDRHPDWAMAGPLTNAAGNEQKIFTAQTLPDAVVKEGLSFCGHADGDCFASHRLDFFCVAVRKKAYVQLGGLDEQFGAGYFEDTDFCMRAVQASMPMMVCEDVFVFHQAGKSFAALGGSGVHRLMRANRSKLRAKHGRKLPLRHLRDCNADVLRAYLQLRAAAQDPRRIKGLNYRFANRLELARSLAPSHPIRRLFYRLRLNRLKREYARF